MSVGKTATKMYIEINFPIERLSFLTRREKHAMKPVYQMHTWFARRVGSEFRALILAAFLDEETTEEEFWQRFYSATDLGGPIILDPFMGGGPRLSKPYASAVGSSAWISTRSLGSWSRRRSSQ